MKRKYLILERSEQLGGGFTVIFLGDDVEQGQAVIPGTVEDAYGVACDAAIEWMGDQLQKRDYEDDEDDR